VTLILLWNCGTGAFPSQLFYWRQRFGRSFPGYSLENFNHGLVGSAHDYQEILHVNQKAWCWSRAPQERKISTLASILNHVSSVRSDHIVTIEDPIEFCLSQQNPCLVNQREVSRHQSFQGGFALRPLEDPDVVLIGGNARHWNCWNGHWNHETGHLVFLGHSTPRPQPARSDRGNDRMFPADPPISNPFNTQPPLFWGNFSGVVPDHPERAGYYVHEILLGRAISSLIRRRENISNFLHDAIKRYAGMRTLNGKRWFDWSKKNKLIRFKKRISNQWKGWYGTKLKTAGKFSIKL